MISALEVYLVMQLDSLRSVFFTVTMACLGGFLISSLGRIIIFDMGYDDARDTAVKFQKWSALAVIPSLVMYSFTPSSNTMAAMIVLPAITSSEVLGPLGAEAKELYSMAKQALKDAVAQPAEKEIAK